MASLKFKRLFLLVEPSKSLTSVRRQSAIEAGKCVKFFK